MQHVHLHDCWDGRRLRDPETSCNNAGERQNCTPVPGAHVQHPLNFVPSPPYAVMSAALSNTLLNVWCYAAPSTTPPSLPSGRLTPSQSQALMTKLTLGSNDRSSPASHCAARLAECKTAQLCHTSTPRKLSNPIERTAPSWCAKALRVYRSFDAHGARAPSIPAKLETVPRASALVISRPAGQRSRTKARLPSRPLVQGCIPVVELVIIDVFVIPSLFLFQRWCPTSATRCRISTPCQQPDISCASPGQHRTHQCRRLRMIAIWISCVQRRRNVFSSERSPHLLAA
jgi:hypothetical protein